MIFQQKQRKIKKKKSNRKENP